MSRSRGLSRRTVLRGLGTTVALPWLEIMDSAASLQAAQAAAGAAAPVRMAFLFVPNGIIMENWTPAATGAVAELPPTLASLQPYRKDFLLLSGLAHEQAKSNGDGPGDHARSAAAFLTGAHPLKTAGKEIRAGLSVDQLAARHIGRQTRLPSLELGCEPSAQAGNCDSGYSCAYSSNISWSSPQTPVAKEIDPRAVFTRLFGDPTQATDARQKAQRTARQKSILDLVRQDAGRLNQKLGTADQVKMDEYLDAVRALEKRLQEAEKHQTLDLPAEARIPDAAPKDYQAHLRLMMDMLVLAFQTDTTRICTLMFGNEGSNRAYPWLEVKEGHHELSHHGYNTAKMEKVARIDHFHVEQLAYLLQRLSQIKEGPDRLLDRCMLVYGGAIADGHAHRHEDLPVLLAGRGGRALAPGRHLRYPHGTPMCNLFLNMLDAMGLPREERLGDSTGRLDQLAV